MPRWVGETPNDYLYENEDGSVTPYNKNLFPGGVEMYYGDDSYLRQDEAAALPGAAEFAQPAPAAQQSHEEDMILRELVGTRQPPAGPPTSARGLALESAGLARQIIPNPKQEAADIAKSERLVKDIAATKQTASELETRELGKAQAKRQDALFGDKGAFKASEAENQKLDEWAGRIQQKNDALAASQVDPGRLFQDKPGLVIGAAITAGLAGLLQVRRGDKGPNPVLQAMQGAIDRDIAAQQANLENKWRALANERSDLKDARAKAIWMLEQKVKHEDLLYAGAEKMILTQAAGIRNEAQAKEAELMLMDVREKRQERRNSNLAAVSKMLNDSAQVVNQTDTLAFQKKLTSEKQAPQLDPDRMLLDPTRQGKVLVPQGLEKELNKQVRETMTASAQLKGMSDAITAIRTHGAEGFKTRFKALATKLGVTGLSSEQAMLGALYRRSKSLLRRLERSGTMDSGTKEHYDGMLGSESDFIANDAGIQTVANGFIDESNYLLNQAGYQGERWEPLVGNELIGDLDGKVGDISRDSERSFKK